MENDDFVIIDSVFPGPINIAAIFLSRETGKSVNARQIKTAIEYGLTIGGHEIRYTKPKAKPAAPGKNIPASRRPLLRYSVGEKPIERGICRAVV